MCINIIPTAPWSPWRNEVQQPLDCTHVWNRSKGCRNLHSALALPRASRIEDPLRDGLKSCCSETPTAQHIIYNKMGMFESARRPATDPADHALVLSLSPPSPQEKHPQPTQKCLPMASPIKTSSSPMH